MRERHEIVAQAEQEIAVVGIAFGELQGIAG
jgi:hypothetical protein